MDNALPLDFPSPPAWSLMLGEIGRTLVISAAVLYLISILSWLFAPKSSKLKAIGAWSFSLGGISLLVTFVALAILFANNRFEFAYIWSHGDKSNAIQYRVAGIWSGQQGSFLLWACTSAIFGLITARLFKQYRRWFTITYATFLGSLAGILAFESPFVLNTFGGQPFVPADGTGLAPSLQNYWVTIHPPTIFMGFGSLTVLFALAMAALISRDFESWIPIVRPWAMVSTALVGVGLCMGGFWAYETLGWGGFWMWDPVENVSFVPWCCSVAFVHGVIVQATRKKWQMSNLLLGSLPFIVFLYGTFLTRSGFLADASVHSFAEMNRSALKLLTGVVGGAILAFGVLWGIRVYQNKKATASDEHSSSLLKRESFYAAGVIFMIAMGLATMIGMSVPFFMALSGRKPKVVEEGLYHLVLPWIFVPIVLLMASAPFVTWRPMQAKEFWSKLYSVFCIAVGLTGVSLFLTAITNYGKVINMAPEVNMPGGHVVKGLPWLLFLVGLCNFALVGNIWRIAELWKRSKLGVAPFIAHLGVAILMAGLIISRGFEQQDSTIVMKDHPGRVLDYDVQYKGMTTNNIYNRNNHLELNIFDRKSNKLSFVASPGLYNVKSSDGPDSVMVWPHIQHSLLYDVYVSIRPPQPVTSDPIVLQPGKTAVFGGLSITYQELVREGEFGQAGTKFGAKVQITNLNKTVTVVPKMELGGEQGMINHPANIDKDLQIQMLGMNAADKSVTLQVQTAAAIFPVEVFHKPMVLLVWLGTAIMTLGGALSAFYRRPRQSRLSIQQEETSEPAPAEKQLVHT